jgi:gas vesicle protein
MYRADQSGASFALGIMAGAVIGAGVALLFAPKTGTEMRHQLGEQYRGLAERVGETTKGLRESAEHLKERGRERVQRLAGQTTERSSTTYETPMSERFPSSVPSV